MTPRGRAVLALGGLIYLAAWAFGSRPLYPVATGLVLAVILAWAWVRLSNRPMRLYRAVGDGEHTEGDDVPVRLQVDFDGRLAPGSLVVVERIAKLGERRTALQRHGRRLFAKYELEALPRGRYPYEAARAVLEDPFGLEQTVVPLGGAGALVVYPRLVSIERLFTEAGGRSHEGRRLLLRRPSGFDLHSVREYEEGESLRKVHWRSTARRGQLMVKELEDAPRDEVAVLLDADAATVVGAPPDSSFELQVRAAGSILKAQALRGRRAVLVVNSLAAQSQRVHSADGDWRRALELLAAVEPTGRAPLEALLVEDGSAAARALELTVVTARLPRGLVDRLVQRALGRRSVSLVYVDASSFNGVGPRPEPALLNLQKLGVPVVVLRRGDDLAAKLSADPLAGAAGA